MGKDVEKVKKNGYFNIPVGTKIVTPSGDILSFEESEYYTSKLIIEEKEQGVVTHFWLYDSYDGWCAGK